MEQGTSPRFLVWQGQELEHQQRKQQKEQPEEQPEQQPEQQHGQKHTQQQPKQNCSIGSSSKRNSSNSSNSKSCSEKLRKKRSKSSKTCTSRTAAAQAATTTAKAADRAEAGAAAEAAVAQKAERIRSSRNSSRSKSNSKREQQQQEQNTLSSHEREEMAVRQKDAWQSKQKSCSRKKTTQLKQLSSFEERQPFTTDLGPQPASHLTTKNLRTLSNKKTKPQREGIHPTSRVTEVTLPPPQRQLNTHDTGYAKRTHRSRKTCAFFASSNTTHINDSRNRI